MGCLSLLRFNFRLDRKISIEKNIAFHFLDKDLIVEVNDVFNFPSVLVDKALCVSLKYEFFVLEEFRVHVNDRVESYLLQIADLRHRINRAHQKLIQVSIN
jgi:hypothetical protein